MKKALLYAAGILIAVVLIHFSITVLANTEIIVPIIIVICLYLILRFIIKLCRKNEKIKNFIVCLIDLLFFLP